MRDQGVTDSRVLDQGHVKWTKGELLSCYDAQASCFSDMIELAACVVVTTLSVLRMDTQQPTEQNDTLCRVTVCVAMV